MGRDRLWLVASSLVVGLGCGTKAPPDEPDGSQRSLTAKVKAEITVTTTTTETATSTHTETDTETATGSGTATTSIVVTVTETTTGTQTSTYTHSTTSTQTQTAAGNTTTGTATAFNLPVSSTAVGTMTAINDWVASRTYLWTATLTRVATLPTTFDGTGTATGTFADNGVTYSTSGTTTSTMQFTGFATSTKTKTVAAYYSGAVSRTASTTGTGLGWSGRLTWTYTKTATGSHTEVYTQTGTQTLTQTTFPTATHTATATGIGTVTQSGTVTDTITLTITETVTNTATSTATDTSVSDGGVADAPTTTCLQDWRSTACGQACLAETQWDRMHCTVFLDCYFENSCGPATCGGQDDVCGVNQFSYGMAPKIIADQVYECLGCAGTAPQPQERVDLEAQLGCGTDAGPSDVEQSFSPRVFFILPASLPVAQGSAGNGTATLILTQDSSCPEGCVSTCTYMGGANQSHPVTLQDQLLGAAYFLHSCSHGLLAGQAVHVSKLALHLASGDCQASPTTVIVIQETGQPSPGETVPVEQVPVNSAGFDPLPSSPRDPIIRPPDGGMPPDAAPEVDGLPLREEQTNPEIDGVYVPVANPELQPVAIPL